MSKQSFRPTAWDPIKHNEWVQVRRGINTYVRFLNWMYNRRPTKGSHD